MSKNEKQSCICSTNPENCDNDKHICICLKNHGYCMSDEHTCICSVCSYFCKGIEHPCICLINHKYCKGNEHPCSSECSRYYDPDGYHKGSYYCACYQHDDICSHYCMGNKHYCTCNINNQICKKHINTNIINSYTDIVNLYTDTINFMDDDYEEECIAKFKVLVNSEKDNTVRGATLCFILEFSYSNIQLIKILSESISYGLKLPLLSIKGQKTKRGEITQIINCLMCKDYIIDILNKDIFSIIRLYLY